MERRVLLAIFLSFLVLYVYQALVVKPKPADQTANGTTAATSATATSPAAASGASASTPPSAEHPSGGAAPHVVPPPVAHAQTVVGESRERDITVENADVIAVFSNRGARLKNWKL